MTVIIDYDTGNLCSLGNTISRLGADYTVSDNPDIIRAAQRVILPGVGEASTAMKKLKQRSLDSVLKDITVPVLGICIGLQLMCSFSEEGDTQCMGIFPNRVIRFKDVAKIPHMGWNKIENLKSPLFKGIANGEYQYFVHSFAPEILLNNSSVVTIAETFYGYGFASALNFRNFYGTQFHPEKSGEVGSKIIKNFLEL